MSKRVIPKRNILIKQKVFEILGITPARLAYLRSLRRKEWLLEAFCYFLLLISYYSLCFFIVFVLKKLFSQLSIFF